MNKFKRIETGTKDLIVIEPKVFGGNRGFFMESYSKKDFFGIEMDIEFIQDNFKFKKGVLKEDYTFKRTCSRETSKVQQVLF